MGKKTQSNRQLLRIGKIEIVVQNTKNPIAFRRGRGNEDEERIRC